MLWLVYVSAYAEYKYSADTNNAVQHSKHLNIMVI